LSEFAALEDLFHGDKALTGTSAFPETEHRQKNFKDPSSTSTLSLLR
jgi:hypothetical protein